MRPILEYMTDDILVESSYEKMSVLDSCYHALSEDLGNQHVVDIALSYTHSMIIEVLENVKETLYKLYQRVLSVLNNYVLNSANLIDKYRDIVIERYGKLPAPLVFKTYEYPKLKDIDYPMMLQVKSSVIVEKELRDLQDRFVDSGMLPSQVEFEVNKYLRQFGKEVLDAPVSPMNLKESVREIVYSKIRGREIDKKLTQSDLNTFINEIKQHKAIKDDLNRTKTNMLSDYNNLKKLYSSTMKRKEADSGLQALKYPESTALRSADYSRFANINMALTRLFNGFITIYSEAFNVKLQIINEKIAANRKIIEELMLRTGMFTTLNTKRPDRNRRPMTFDPYLKT